MLTSLQGATAVVVHATFTRMLLSFTLRTYQYLEWNDKRRQRVESNSSLQEFQKAQLNESEYAALIAAPLFYLALVNDNGASAAATLAVTGQAGYVWTRTVFGYPKLISIFFAVVRYAGLAMISMELYTLLSSSS